MPADLQHFAFEYKWDGVRALCSYDGRGKLKLASRNRRDITSHYPELISLGKALGRKAALLDGEIVALDEQGKPSFGRLQERMHVQHPRASLVEQTPVWYVLFDVLWLRGKWLLDQPYTRRRELLESLTLRGPFWHVTPAHVGEGTAMLQAAEEQGMEGLVAKRLDSTYEPGRRSPLWRKIKLVHRQEFVLGGWIAQEGNDQRVGSLLIGYYDCDGRLLFAGGVGTGFTDAEHQKLVPLLNRHMRSRSPFAGPVPRTAKGLARFLNPVLVAEIEYRRWPEGGSVQQGAYKGLRFDKEAKDVVKEHP